MRPLEQPLFHWLHNYGRRLFALPQRVTAVSRTLHFPLDRPRRTFNYSISIGAAPRWRLAWFVNAIVARCSSAMNRGLRPTPAYFFSSPFNRRACKRNRIADRWNNVDGWYVRYCWARWNFWFRNLTRVCLPSEVVHKLAVRRLGPRAAALGDRGWRRKMLGWMMRLNAAPLCTELLRRRNWSCVLWGGGIIRD